MLGVNAFVELVSGVLDASTHFSNEIENPYRGFGAGLSEKI